MTKLKRIMALTGVILLIGLYIVTFIAGVTNTPSSTGLFKASIYCTVGVPGLLYAYMLVYRLLKNKDKKKEEL